jgi:hypothetical protein
VRAFLAVVVGVVTSVALAGSAAAATNTGAGRQAAVALPWSGLSVGVNDDSGKSALRDWVYPVMSDDGLRLNTLTLTWDESDPLKILGRAELAAAIAAAQENGIATEFDLYPLHSQVFTHGNRCKPSADPESCGDSARIAQFAAWTAQVANAFPSVHQFVVMNECNQPRFLNPQWNASGQNQSAAICGRALAAAYDALKDADRSNFIWGVGLSPRGNDAPRAVSNSSTSPVKFLAGLGAWFKAYAAKTHRAAPLMDGFDFHPYPVPQSLPFATGYANPNDASITNLPRIYQAFYKAFAGSAQRTIGQQRGGGLPVSLNETGVQTASSGPAYFGSQASARAAGGVLGRWATEDYQARWYVAMLNVVACDPNVRLVNIFHLLDEADLGGWQSGLYFADRKPKLSAAAVRGWIASTGARCHGTQLPWKPGSVLSLPTIDLSKLKLPTSTPVVLPSGIGLVGQLPTSVVSQAAAPNPVAAISLLADTASTTPLEPTAPADQMSGEEAPPPPEETPPPEG